MKTKLPALIEKKTFAAYLYASLRKTTLYDMLNRTLKLTGRFLFLTRLVGYIYTAIRIIEASAILILLSALLFAVIPLVLITLSVLATVDYILGSRFLRSPELSHALSRDKIYVISRASGFGEGFARELYKSGAAVFVTTGDLKKRFVTVKEESGVFYIRHAFFFRLKRRRFSKEPSKMRYLL